MQIGTAGSRCTVHPVFQPRGTIHAVLCRQIRTGGKTKLYEILRQSYGCRLGEHLRNLRMGKARTLREERTEMTISEIATACGYDNYSYFIASFSKYAGQSPRQYRRKKQQYFETFIDFVY